MRPSVLRRARSNPSLVPHGFGSISLRPERSASCSFRRPLGVDVVLRIRLPGRETCLPAARSAWPSAESLSPCERPVKAHQEGATAEQAAGTAKPAAVAAEATREERLEDAEASGSRGASSSAACHFARSPRALQQTKPAVEKSAVVAMLPPSLPFSRAVRTQLSSNHGG